MRAMHGSMSGLLLQVLVSEVYPFLSRRELGRHTAARMIQAPVRCTLSLRQPFLSKGFRVDETSVVKEGTRQF